MDPLTATAASGLRARLESLDLLANNLANASTGGYKADREFYSLYIAPEAVESDAPTTMPLIERPWVDLSQGTLHSTGNSLDVALSGKGFFTVDGPAGPLYTRNGSFHLAADGRLLTADGYPVRGANGTLTLVTSRPIEILRDGTVQQNGQVIGQLAIADFTSSASLAKQGNNYFIGDGTPPASAPRNTTIEQGQLEESNTAHAEGAVRLVGIMRQFEMLQKAAQIGNDMGKQAIEQVAKVGS
jgi:flagellar basal-body rod protein FlgF